MCGVRQVAPGVSIRAAYPAIGSRAESAYLSGTSMAAPHVAGAALQLLQIFPHAKPAQVQARRPARSSDPAARLRSSGHRSSRLHRVV